MAFPQPPGSGWTTKKAPEQFELICAHLLYKMSDNAIDYKAIKTNVLFWSVAFKGTFFMKLVNIPSFSPSVSLYRHVFHYRNTFRNQGTFLPQEPYRKYKHFETTSGTLATSLTQAPLREFRILGSFSGIPAVWGIFSSQEPVQKLGNLGNFLCQRRTFTV